MCCGIKDNEIYYIHFFEILRIIFKFVPLRTGVLVGLWKKHGEYMIYVSGVISCNILL